MKKYIIVVALVLLLPTVGYAKCCDCCQDKYFTHTIVLYGTTTYTFIAGREPINSNSFRNTGIEKLIGKVVHRTKPVICAKSPTGYDRSYIEEPRKLLAVTDKYLILSSDILASGQFEIDRTDWDDGSWEEFVKPKRLIINEMVDNKAFYVWEIISDRYSCVRCGKQLRCSTRDFNYYCTSCKTGFNIKEE